ncbi:MAG: MBL fold metallo-hydrolase [Marinifilaceae bacterium]|jgi:glyoxylase-like metal-dependent hydrolase (beta-lactamase superfamily II)|nr:MBL fold metallo-hydrolase [Marinifilaceae bacterium]
MKRFLVIFLIIGFQSCNSGKWGFKVKEINYNTYQISEIKSKQNNVLYLFLTSNEALLFDLGSNPKFKVEKIIRTLTDLPLSYLPSHFHFDHIANISNKTRILLHESQLINKNKDSIITIHKNLSFGERDIKFKYSRILKGDSCIQIGDRNLQIIPTSGHSPYSICIIDHKHKQIFSGDLVYNDLLLIDNLKEYINSVEKIIKLTDKSYKIYGAHKSSQVKYQKLLDLKCLLNKILKKDYQELEIENTINKTRIIKHKEIEILIKI